MSRAVLVQASCHGTDNRALLDALRRGEGRYAAVAMIDETHTDRHLREMHRLGVRGVRFNFVAHLGGAPDGSRLRDIVDRVATLGWHVDLHFDATDLEAHVELLKELPVPFIIDHMARISAEEGVEQAPFRALLDLVTSSPRCWVKISGAERITAGGGPPYDDVVPFARALVEAAPDRILWGTDWPHPNVRQMPDDGDLVDTLTDFVPDERTRSQILVDNPRVLYEFS